MSFGFYLFSHTNLEISLLIFLVSGSFCVSVSVLYCLNQSSFLGGGGSTTQHMCTKGLDVLSLSPGVGDTKVD